MVNLIHLLTGGDHKVEAGQRPKSDPGAQGQGQTDEDGQRQIPGGSHGNATANCAITHTQEQC